MRSVFKFLDAVVLPLFSVVFLYGYFMGKLSLGKTVSLVSLYLIMTFSLFAAKKYRTRLTSAIAYVASFVGFLTIVNVFYRSFSEVNLLDIAVILGLGLFAILFKFKGYMVTGAIIGFWYAMYKYVTEQQSLQEIFTVYMGNEELTNYISQQTIASGMLIGLFCGLVVAVFSVIGKGVRKVSTRPRGAHVVGTGYAGDYYNYDTEREDSKDDESGEVEISYSMFSNYDNDEESESQGSRSDNRTAMWGQTQSTIDYYSERENYGTPTWYEEKKREEDEYGLPWYAREKD